MPELDLDIEAARVALISDVETATRKGAEASRQLSALGIEPNLEALQVAVVMERDGAKEELAEAEKKLAEWRYGYTQAAITMQAALTGRRRAEAQLNELYGHHAAYFAEFAEEKTQAAHAAFLAVQEGYAVAQTKWVEAQRAWNPVHVGLLAIAESGIGHVEAVPDLTDENFGLVRSGFVAARPRGVQVEEPAIEVVEG